jgi:hypothetical protein
MTNLLSETTAKLESIGKAPEDIVHIGNQVYSCTWDEFTQLADFDYDSGFGSPEVASDLVILFDDNSWLERGEYDGSEWWRYVKAPPIPSNPKSITRLNRHDDTYLVSLGYINDTYDDTDEDIPDAVDEFLYYAARTDDTQEDVDALQEFFDECRMILATD